MPGQRRSIRQCRFTGSGFVFAIAGFAAAAFPALGLAEDLVEVYRDALRSDAVYSAARFTLDAGRERLPQAQALLLPTLNLTASATQSRADADSRSPAVSPSFTREPHSATYALNFSQPVFRPRNQLQRTQADFQVKQAEATFGQATQDLIVRTAQAYFDVLAAQDTLALVGAQKAAISEQLAQARRNFEVGTATITDTHEAQARYDLIVSQEIASRNDVETRRRSLQLVTGKEYARLSGLRPEVRLSPPNPPQMQAWVELAEKQGYLVQIQEAVAEVANLETRRARADHWPTIDIVASHGQTAESASIQSSVRRDLTNSSISLQFAVPLYQGGAITSREREVAANYNRARADLEGARNNAALAARQVFASVVNGIAQIAALEQALVSSQSALASNRLGYEVGVRINIDVLNAQQQLFQTRRDLALARYNTITNQLRLKAAAGSLRVEDLDEVNRALAP